MDSAPAHSRRSDPLLTSARWLLWFMIGVLALGVIAMTVGIVGILTFLRGATMAKIAAAGAPASAYGLVVVGFVMVVAVMVLTARLLWELKAIVQSVRDDDPFQPENANRLQRMGWLALGGKAVWLVIVIIVRGAARYLEPGRQLPEPNLLSGLLLVLILFILARVFRAGAAMRDDLEGTV